MGEQEQETMTPTPEQLALINGAQVEAVMKAATAILNATDAMIHDEDNPIPVSVSIDMTAAFTAAAIFSVAKNMETNTGGAVAARDFSAQVVNALAALFTGQVSVAEGVFNRATGETKLPMRDVAGSA